MEELEQSQEEPKESKEGVWLPGQVAFNQELNNNDKMVWWLVNALDDEDRHCWAGNYYLSQRLNLSQSTVSRSISRLIELDYLQNVSFNGSDRVIKVNEDLYKDHKKYIHEWNRRKKVKKKDSTSPNTLATRKKPEFKPKQNCGTEVYKESKTKEVNKNESFSKEKQEADNRLRNSTSEFFVPTVCPDEAQIETQQTQSVESIPTRTPKGTPKNKQVGLIQPKQIQRTLKQKPIAPKPLPKVPKHIVELIDYWNSFEIVQHKMPNTGTYREAAKMLKKLLNGTFFDKNGKFGEYADRAFTEQEIKNSIANFALAANNYNYLPINGYKKKLQDTSLPRFLHNSFGTEERSFFLEYLDKKPELAKVSGYLMDEDEEESLMTLQLKKEYLRITKKEKINSIEDIQKIKFDTVEENKFRLATKKLNAFYKDNKKKFSSWCAGELYSGTMAAKGKRAQYFLEFIFKNKNEEVSKICPGNLCSDYSLDNFAKWCNDQGLFEG